jgi:hypothetical protein
VLTAEVPRPFSGEVAESAGGGDSGEQQADGGSGEVLVAGTGCEEAEGVAAEVYLLLLRCVQGGGGVLDSKAAMMKQGLSLTSSGSALFTRFAPPHPAP